MLNLMIYLIKVHHDLLTLVIVTFFSGFGIEYELMTNFTKCSKA